MHSLDIRLAKPISPHVIADVLPKLAYLDEHVRGAAISPDGATVTLSLAHAPSREAQRVLAEQIDQLVAAMSQDGFEPILRVLDKVEFPHAGSDDPLPALMQANEVIAEGPGFFALGPTVTSLIDLLERAVLDIAAQVNAVPYRFPALIAPGYLEQVQYFKNFPHALSFATHLRENVRNIERFSAEARMEGGRIAADPTLYARVPAMLSPTVCHHLYHALAGRQIGEQGLVATACGHCFRYEASNMASLERLWNFTMREIIVVGSEDHVDTALGDLQHRVRGLLEKLQISYTLMTANDPFFIGTFRSQAAYQAAFELKHEIRAALPFRQGTLAIGSYNRHGDFFGRTLGIRLPDGQAAHTGCFGLGFERAAYAFLAQHTIDANRWPLVVREAINVKRPPLF